jgi:hypothetical protein
MEDNVRKKMRTSNTITSTIRGKAPSKTRNLLAPKLTVAHPEHRRHTTDTPMKWLQYYQRPVRSTETARWIAHPPIVPPVVRLSYPHTHPIYSLQVMGHILSRYTTYNSTSSQSAGPLFAWDDVGLSYAKHLQSEFDNEHRALSAERVNLSRTEQQVFECGICMEDMPVDSVARPDPCGHAFCRECMRGYVSASLEEHRFPILCPTCTATSNGKEVTRAGGS